MPGIGNFRVRFSPVVLDPVELESLPEPSPLRRPNTSLKALLRIATVMLMLALLYTAYLSKTLLLPIVLAAFIATCLAPVLAVSPRWMPRGIAVFLIVASALLGGGLLGSALIGPAQDWLVRAPQAAKAIAPKLSELTKRVHMASRATDSIVALGAPVNSPAPAAAESRATAISLWDALAEAPRVLGSVFAVVLLVYFFLLHGDALLRRLVEISPTFTQKRRVVAIVRAIQTDTARYLFTTVLINLGLAVVVTALTWALGLSDPWLWGALAGILNFIPYIGALVTAGLLLIFGLMQFDSLGAAVLPVACFLAVTTLEGQFITPAVLGRHLSLSPVAILLWLMLWGWLWGIAGVLLGVPMLMVLKIICVRLDSWHWVAHAIEQTEPSRDSS